MFSQEIIYSNDKIENDLSKEKVESYSGDSENVKDKSKISYKVEFGSAFSTSKAFGNALSFYTAPQFKYKFTPKLNISAGIMLINTSISDYYLIKNQQKRNISQAFMFSGFDYNATEKLRISGEILYGMNNSQMKFSNAKNSSDYSIRFSAEYKINENFSIGFQVVNKNMGYPGYGNQFGNDAFGNYNSPFNSFNRY